MRQIPPGRRAATQTYNCTVDKALAGRSANQIHLPTHEESTVNILGVQGTLNPVTISADGLPMVQTWNAARAYMENGAPRRLKVQIRFDDSCRNGHATFAMTADDFCRGRIESCGQLHATVAIVFPELVPLIKWHLTSTDGPLHYVANTVYHAQNGNFNFARSTAVWPEATDEQLALPRAELTALLLARLPALMAEFNQTMSACGFANDTRKAQ